MRHLKRGFLVPFALLLTAVGVAIAGCGSGDATKLLQQTFSGKHQVNSGNLNFNLTINPSGSSTLRGPITVTFGGPFQSQGKGKLPQSNFNISVNALGKSGSVGILSTGSAGYVTLQGTAYQMPAATFQRLESSFSQFATSGQGGSGTNALAKLGIQPLHWLQNPSVVGDESVGGTDTTHIRAGVNVVALLSDLNTFLQRASQQVPGASRLPTGLNSQTQKRIAGELKNVQFDVWTGKSDKTLRKLAIKLTLPVSGQISTVLGGLRSADIAINMQYANLNQPQTISAPANVRPFNEFATKIRGLVQNLQSGLGSSLLGGGGGTTGGGGTSGAGTGGPTNGNVQAYTNCIQSAGNNIQKMQQCASLLNGK